MTHPIETRAANLQHKIRGRIEQRCSEASYLQWQAIAEQAAEEVLGDEWEWRVLTSMGGKYYPEIIITRHVGFANLRGDDDDRYKDEYR